MKVEIINTGSELMLGRVLNTHQQWLCRRLADLGHVVSRQTAIADRAGQIRQAVSEALDRADLVITTGGLGSTSDDITREEIATMLGKRLVKNPEVEAHIESYFARLGRPRPQKAGKEAMVPENAIVLPNPMGTAPGLAMEVRHSPPRWLIMLPGPPRELHPLFEQSAGPLIQRLFPAEPFACLTLRTTGVGESRVQELIENDLSPLLQEGLETGYCARPGAVDIRLTAGGSGSRPLIDRGAEIVRKHLGGHLYGTESDDIEQVVVQMLISRKKTLALAESCTGGCISHRITNVPGASAIFRGGAVTYSNSAKEKILGVKAETLALHGAVSEAVALEMASGALKAFGADYGIAATGIAGPGGGTPDKPAGTVFVALASSRGAEAKKFFNAWERETFKEVTATQSLEWLRKVLASELP